MTREVVICLIVLATAIANPLNAEENIKYSVLGIEYIGKSDKPITPIVISDSKQGAEWYRTVVLKRSELELTSLHVVSSSLLEKLIGDAQQYRRDPQREQGTSQKSSESVSVTIVTPQGRRAFRLDTQLASSLLSSLQKRCRDDESLRSDLRHFQDRLLH
jgi:hypothetical protein